MKKTKARTAVGLVLSLVMAATLTLIAGCGSGASNGDVQATAPTETSSSSETTTATPTAPSADTTTGSSWDEWKQFLVDYEAWVDDYVVFMDKYAANPTDSSLITDYTAFANEALELQQRASKVPSDLTLEQATES